MISSAKLIKKFTALSFLLLVYSVTWSQDQTGQKVSFPCGIYFTAAAAASATPDLSYSQLTAEYKILLTQPKDEFTLNCFESIQFSDQSGKFQSKPTNEIFMICADGALYVKYQNGKQICFHQLIIFGSISKFEMRETNEVSSTSTSLVLRTPPSTTTIERFLEIKTGKIYNRNEVKDLIRKDADFKEVKITKGNLDEVILQYNAKNKLPFQEK